LGYIVRGESPLLREPLVMTAAERSRVAELEHESWAAEKLLAGWRPGPARDKVRRVHEDLRPFRELGEEATKDLSQVELLGKLLVSADEPTCFRERWIGVVEDAAGESDEPA